MAKTDQLRYFALFAALMLTVGCNDNSGNTAAFASSGSVSEDAILKSYAAQSSKPGGTVTVQGMRKVKIDNLCRLLERNADNNVVQISPSKWKNTRSFLLNHADEMSYFCSKYTNLGDLWDALQIDPKDVKKADLSDSLDSVASVMSGDDISTGPKKVPTLTGASQCPGQPVKPTPTASAGGGDKTQVTKAATDGMTACSPALSVGLLLVNTDPSSLNYNLTASAVACLSLYSGLLKKNNIEPIKAPASTGAQNCAKNGAQAKKAGADGGGSGDDSGGGSDSSGGDSGN